MAKMVKVGGARPYPTKPMTMAQLEKLANKKPATNKKKKK